jgi:hypothetical protein
MQLWSPSRLRNGVKNWKEITPGPLQKAIEALRRNFEESTWKISEIMRQGCYPALHRGMGKQARMINDAIKKIGHPAFPSVDEGESEPTVFTAYFDRSTELLAKEIQRTFSHFLDIASAQSALLNSDPVDWASLQTRLLIADESHRTPLWTKNTCDKQPYDPLDDPNEAIHWTKWRAPKWFFMQPFGSRPYDPITAWDRMDEGESRHLLEVIEDRFNQHLVMALEKAVDETHIQLAKRRNQMELRQGPPESGSKQHAPRAPKPPTMLSGTGGWTSPHPKPMQIPPNPPAFFPLDLWPKTCVVLAEAVKKFPNRNQQLAELCRHYISEMTPLFYEAMRAGTMKGGAVLQEGLGGMQDLLRSLLVYNDYPHSGFGGLSDGSYQIYQEARNSEEWRKLARTIADAQAHHSDEVAHLRANGEVPKSTHTQNSEDTLQLAATDRRALVKAYIEEVRSKTGKRITKRDIWSKAGYQTRTEFERWERQDSKHPNRSADKNFTRLLREKPHLR